MTDRQDALDNQRAVDIRSPYVAEPVKLKQDRTGSRSNGINKVIGINTSVRGEKMQSQEEETIALPKGVYIAYEDKAAAQSDSIFKDICVENVKANESDFVTSPPMYRLQDDVCAFGPPQYFRMAIRKNKQGTPLGIDVALAEHGIVILEIKREGLVADWMASHPGKFSMQFRYPVPIISQVNSKFGNGMVMMEEIRTAQELDILVFNSDAVPEDLIDPGGQNQVHIPEGATDSTTESPKRLCEPLVTFSQTCGIGRHWQARV